MSLVGIVLGRIRPHLATWLGVLTSVLVTAATVGALTLLSGAIGDASSRGLVEAAEPTARSLSVTVPVRAGDLAAVESAVDDVLAPLHAGADRTVVATTTSRGIEGQPENARAVLAEVRDPDAHAELAAGRWPAPVSGPDDPASPLEVALHEGAAQALGVAAGDRVELIDLLDKEAPPRPAEIVGTYLPTDATAAVWAELPIAGAGTTTSEFDSYGPFLLGQDALDHGAAGSATATWRVTPQVEGLDAGRVEGLAGQVARALDAARAASSKDDPRAVPELRGAQVVSDLPGLLTEAGQLAARAQAVLLMPILLLVLLGGTALAVSVTLLGLLREGETRLLRTRGAGSRQLAVMALVEGLLIVGAATIGGLLLAPALATAVGAWGDLETSRLTLGAAARTPTLLGTLGGLAVLALVTIVVTSALRSRDLVRGDQRHGLARVLAAAGLDVVLLALGVLAFLQLRRYAGAEAGTLDPLTAAAPGLLVAALAVATLRVLPLLARVAARLTATRSLPVTWGGWQLARRIGSQAGALMLILLAVPISVLAVAQQSTTTAAIADQSRFLTGADLRVEPRPDRLRDPELVARIAERAGGRERVMPASRETVTLGSLDGVTLIGVDATTAGQVAEPRADLVTSSVPGQDWSALMTRLAQSRPAASATVGIPLPNDATSVELTLDLAVRTDGFLEASEEMKNPSGTALVVVTDADGQTWATSLGTVKSGQPLEIPLPESLPRPLSITAIQLATMLAWFGDEKGSVFSLHIAGLTADGRDLPFDGLDSSIVRNGRAILTSTWPEVPPPPAVVTRAVATDLEVGIGDRIALTFRGQSLEVEVAGLITHLPTALDPERGVLADLATLNAAAIGTAQDKGAEGLIQAVPPREFWLAPVDLDATREALAQDGTVTTTGDATELAAQRRGGPVHAGMRAALLLVSITATLLAALGFAATTAAVGRTRRHESAVLHALGLPPRQIRGTVLIERWAVIALAVAAGIAIGVVVTVVVVPLLVGGDGYRLVPPVQPVIPATMVALVAALTSAALVAGTLVAAGQVTRGLTGALREGGD